MNIRKKVLVASCGPRTTRAVEVFNDAGFDVEWSWSLDETMNLLWLHVYDWVVIDSELDYRAYKMIDGANAGTTIVFDPESESENIVTLCRRLAA
jgi:hypothetical protein